MCVCVCVCVLGAHFMCICLCKRELMRYKIVKCFNLIKKNLI